MDTYRIADELQKRTERPDSAVMDDAREAIYYLNVMAKRRGELMRQAIQSYHCKDGRLGQIITGMSQELNGLKAPDVDGRKPNPTRPG